MKKLFVLLLVLGMFSCTQKICLTDKDSGKSKTFKYRGSVLIDEEHVHFLTVKGSKQSVPKNMYLFEVE